jgi:hypothetical protein
MFDLVPAGNQARIVGRDHDLTGARPNGNRADLNAKAAAATQIRCARVSRDAPARLKPNAFCTARHHEAMHPWATDRWTNGNAIG